MQRNTTPPSSAACLDGWGRLLLACRNVRAVQLHQCRRPTFHGNYGGHHPHLLHHDRVSQVETGGLASLFLGL